jgi:hypothetical protein
MLAILLGHVLPNPLEQYPPGVVGWAVVHHYSKQHEQLLYILSLGGVLAFTITAFAEWRWFSKRLSAEGVPVVIAQWIGAVTLLVGCVVFMAAIPSGNAFLNLLLLPEAVAAIAIAQWLAWILRAKLVLAVQPTDVPVLDNLDLLPPATDAESGRTLVAAYGIVIALLTGAIAGCYLPFAIANTAIADTVSSLWMIWLAVFPGIGVFLTWRLVASQGLDVTAALNRALYVYLPILGLSAMPFLWASLAARIAVQAVVFAGMLALATLVLSRKSLPRMQPWIILGFVGLLLAAMNANTVLLQNPTFLRGVFITPFDGENIYNWINNGLLGRIPFRDFFYPYGPLLFYFHVILARIFHLDGYITPYFSALGFLAVVLAFYIGGYVQRWRITTLLIAPVIYLVYELSELRVWVGCVAIATLLLALERPSRWRCIAAGALLPIALLWSPEIGITAALASGGAIALFIVSRRGALRSFPWRESGRLFSIGLGLIIVPAIAVGAATHSLLPYLRQTRDFFQIVDACCSSPFPPLFAGSVLSIPLGHNPAWLFRDVTFHLFYVGPIIICIAGAFLLIRFLALRKLERDDVMLGAFVIFAALLFRTALGRSEEGHAEFVMLPEYFIGFFLVERSVFAGWLGFQMAVSVARRGARKAVVLWFLQGTACFGFAWLLVFGLFRLQDTPVWTVLSGTTQNVHQYYTIERSPPTGGFVRPAWHEVVSASGDTFFFQNAEGADVAPTVAYLKEHLRPGDLVYGFPFAPRYPLVLNLPMAIPMGQDLGWGPGALPKRQQQMIGEFEASRTRFLVYSAADWPDPDGVPWMDRTPSVVDYFYTHYALVKRFGDTLVFERKSPESPPAVVDAGSLLSVPYLRSGWYYPEKADAGRFSWMTDHATAVASQNNGDNYFEIEVLTTPLPANGPGANFLVVEIDGKQILSRDLAAVPPGLWRFGVPVLPAVSPGVRQVSLSVDRTLPLPGEARLLSLPVLRFGFTHRAGTLSDTREPLPLPKSALTTSAATLAPAASAAPTGLSYPLGLVISEEHPITGIFPSAAASCCWITSSGSFSLQVPRSATRLLVRVQVPSVYATGAEGLRLKIGDAPAEAKRALPRGNAELTFTVPRAARGKMTAVQFALDKTFVPADLHINADTTRYGLILTGIRFK